MPLEKRHFHFQDHNVNPERSPPILARLFYVLDSKNQKLARLAKQRHAMKSKPMKAMKSSGAMKSTSTKKVDLVAQAGDQAAEGLIGVTIKNNIAPERAPKILNLKPKEAKYFDSKPIITTLPQVKNNTL